MQKGYYTVACNTTLLSLSFDFAKGQQTCRGPYKIDISQNVKFATESLDLLTMSGRLLHQSVIATFCFRQAPGFQGW
jgi:hypothetical protein